MISSARDCTKKLKVAKLTQFSKSPQLMVFNCVKSNYAHFIRNYFSLIKPISTAVLMQKHIFYNGLPMKRSGK